MTSALQQIELVAKHKRYFTNPCANAPQQFARYVDNAWLCQHINHLLKTLVERRVGAEECEEGGPYTGVGGIANAILRVFAVLSEKNYLKISDQLLDYQLTSEKKASQSRLCRYLTGTLGLYTIQALSRHFASQPIDAIDEIFRSMLANVLMPGYQRIGDDELMNGRAGYLTGVLLLMLETGRRVLTDEEIGTVLGAMLASGRDYSHRRGSSARLMYQWHDSEYLGAAHGVAGIYQTFFSYWNYLTEKNREDVVQSVDWFLSLQSSEGNFPSSSRHIGEDRGDNELVHWCHGATGAIQMLIAGYVAIGAEKYLRAAESCAEVIWHKGLLRKGPGICHGVAGSGYAFLLLHRLTDKPEYLARAKAFAFIMMDSNFSKSARVPDSPFSLFEGWAGSLCFLADLMRPNSAQFPMVPIDFMKRCRKASAQ